ncbi:MAG: site-specific integrase [Phycisphaeraceae bacterium]|nr:site-specific integrase [Phycisphaeraceae bacterium]
MNAFTTELEAKAFENELRARLEKGLVVDTKAPSEKHTLGVLRDKAVEKFWKGTKGERMAVLNADLVVEMLGDIEVRLITSAVIDLMISELKTKGNSGGTINRKLSALSKMLKLADDLGWLTKMPRISKQKEAEHRVRWLTQEEEDQVCRWFNHIGDTDMHDLVVFLIDTGARLSEALNLTKPDVRESNGEFWATLRKTKNGTTRVVPLPPRVWQMLQQRPAGLSFFPPELTVSAIDHRWDRMRTKLGLEMDEEFVPHVLRHTYASRLVQRGVELLTVSKLCGHKSIMTTQRYAHLAPKNHQEAIKVLGRADFVKLRLLDETPSQEGAKRHSQGA